jgi:precorrin-2 dehydrogenase / sirohydrochlorin ferrochelatase
MRSSRAKRSRLFPVFIKLQRRLVIVVGAGSIGEGKIRGLLSTGAHIKVIAPEATPATGEWARAGQIAWEERSFLPSDLDGAFLAVVATSLRVLNQQIFRECRRRGVLCNVVDVPELCDFYYPAVVQRGDLQIAVSTSGQSPSLARKIREQLEGQYGPSYEQWVAELGKTRRRVLASKLDSARKRELLHSLASVEAFEAAVAEIKQEEGSVV